jgi:peptidyl-prolyl cis-trans isomerase D
MLTFFRTRKWLWVVLIAVFSLALIVSLVPGSFGPELVVSGNVAEVGSEVVTAAEFQTAFHGYMDQVGGELTPEMLSAFGFDTQVMDQLINQYVMIAEAKRLGLDAAPAEIQTLILQNAAFQENGQFIGLQRYQDLLAQNGLTVEDFENSIRDQILMEKLYTFLTAPMSVSDEEIEAEYRYSNEQAQLDYFVIDGPAVEAQIELEEDELLAYYEENAARYTVPEKRRAKYVFVDSIQVRSEVIVSDDELLAAYNARITEFEIEPRATAQHILFRTQEKTAEEIDAIRELATDVVERAKAGEDFGELAMEYSDDTSAQFGGDLGSFGPGQMVPPFEQAAFAMGPGATSDLVETQFGIHIIRVNDIQEGRTQTFEEVRPIIEGTLRLDIATDVAAGRAQAIAVALVTNDDVEAVAAEHGAQVRETDLIARGDVMSGLTDTAALENRIFAMGLDEVGTAVEVANGHVIPVVTEIQESRPATYDEATGEVTDDLRFERAADLADLKVTEVQDLIEGGESLEAAAEAAGLEVLISQPLTRDGSIPEFGSTTELDNQIFSLEPGTPGTPVTVAGRTIAFAVAEREELDSLELQVLLPNLRTEMLDLRKAQMFSAYGEDVRTRMQVSGEISINESRMARAAEAALIGHVH